MVKLSSLKVWDAAEPNDFWRLNPPDANTLYVPERAAWVIEGGCVYGKVNYSPTSAGPYVIAGYQGFSSAFQRLDPDTGTAPHYLFLWTPGDADRTYTLLAGVDVEGGDPNDSADPNDIDCQTVQITTKVVQIEPNVAVSGAGQSNRDPNIWITPVDPNEYVELTAILNPSAPDHEAVNLLHWSGGLTDGNYPRSCWVEVDEPGDRAVIGAVGDSEASVIVRAVTPTVDDDTIWWFAELHPANYTESTTGRAVGALEGEFRWFTSAGTGNVMFENGSLAECIKWNDAEVGIDSHDGSETPNDVGIALEYDGVYCGEARLTVHKPAAAVVVSGPTDYDRSVWPVCGYLTKYGLEIQDQFGEPMPFPVEFNEAFDWSSDTSDWPNENWNWQNPNGRMTSPNTPARFWDNYGITGYWPFWTPVPTSPSDPNASNKVDHMTQFYNVGSQTIMLGIEVKRHTLQRYRGKARQE